MASPSIPLVASDIAKLSLHDPTRPQIQLQSTEHRTFIVEKWDIKPGSKILEIGCGQGDCTVVLATAVGESGHVVAIDPGDPDYGSPETLGQAQGHISKGPLGSRITFIRATPIEHLESMQTSETTYDYAVLALSLWYFSTPLEIAQTLAILSKHAKKICIAEWSLAPSKAYPIESHPHVLAALAMGALASRQPAGTSDSNIRTLISPAGIKGLIPGLKCLKEVYVTPNETVLDGKWEVEWVLSDRWEKKVHEVLQGDGPQRERDISLVLAMRDAVRSSVQLLSSSKMARSMDVWCAIFSHER